jgi:fructosamine-3-kinase
VSLPDPIRDAVGRALRERDLGGRITRVAPVSGGCINHGARIETEAGAELFLKWNAAAPPGMFAAEADGLASLALAGELRVPKAIAWDPGGTTRGPGGGRSARAAEGDPGLSWLLLEYLAPGRVSRFAEEALGRGLARLHTAGARAGVGASAEADTFGWHRDNWIGSLPQDNTPTPSWADFWRDRRIMPQLDAARRRGHFAEGGAASIMLRVLDAIPGALGYVAQPELVHGDLWGGNWFTSESEDPVLIDPAVYLGHGEVDLAMSELFGGFGDSFYRAYRDERGIPAEYDGYRRDLYQLYYLLVHVNLFGASYEPGALRAARRVCAALEA